MSPQSPNPELFLRRLLQGWKMTLALVAALPVIAVISLFVRPLRRRVRYLLDAALLRSGSLTEQALGGMRTLASLCGEEGEAAKVRPPPCAQGTEIMDPGGCVRGEMLELRPRLELVPLSAPPRPKLSGLWTSGPYLVARPRRWANQPCVSEPLKAPNKLPATNPTDSNLGSAIPELL